MAPKYKALLINTFLAGTKDSDHLMRASALSNLGELCRVLGFKLGSILTEVMCIIIFYTYFYSLIYWLLGFGLCACCNCDG